MIEEHTAAMVSQKDLEARFEMDSVVNLKNAQLTSVQKEAKRLVTEANQLAAEPDRHAHKVVDSCNCS